MSMSSQDYGSLLFSHHSMIRESPICGSCGSTNDDREAVTGDDNDGQRLSFSDQGITPISPLNPCFDGQIRRIQDTDWKERVFLIVSALAILTSTCFTSYRLHTVDKHQTDFLFQIVILVNTLFCWYYLVHGVLKERRYEILILIIITIIRVVYVIVNFTQGVEGTITLARLISACCLAFGLMIAGLYPGFKYRPPGRLICRTTSSGDPKLQSMCNKLFLFMDLLKLDLQLGITMALFTHVNDPSVNTLDIVVLCVGIVISLVWFVLGHMCVRRESKILTYLFTVLSPLELCYVIYKITMACQHLTLYPVIAPCSITTGCLAVTVRVTIIILTYLVSMNYGKGLKEKVFKPRKPEPFSEDAESLHL